MLVLGMFLAIGVFSIAFLLRAFFALHAEARLENERDVRTKQMPGRHIPIVVETRTLDFDSKFPMQKVERRASR